jgi:hypothetical protein
VDEFEMGEEGVGHVLVEEGCGIYEVEGHSVWSGWQIVSALIHSIACLFSQICVVCRLRRFLKRIVAEWGKKDPRRGI